VVLYTTPTNFPPIEKLTSRYRLLAFGLFVLVTLIYSYTLSYLILPMKRVLNSLEGSRGGIPQLLHNAKSLLERAYNNLARDALVTKLSSRLHELISSNKQIERNQMLSQAPQIVTDMFAVPACAIFEGRPEGESLMSWRPLGVSYFSGDDPQTQDLSKRCARLVAQIQKEIGLASAQELPSFQAHNFGDTEFRDLAVWRHILSPEEVPSYPCLIVFVYRSNLSEEQKDWAATTFSRIAEELRRSLEHLEIQRQRLFEEKSEANINLSRNLGHDLTNIIATSKLDLMTVNRLLELSPEELQKSAEKEQIFRQSLANLLNNTKFLQEIVNIYRAFSFVKRPMYESVDLNKLVKEILDLFLMSLSRSITIRARLDSNIPPCRVETRLFKLAVFNLLTNAIEAIKKASTEYELRGEIVLTTEYLADQGAVEVRIADNGPGIRNAQGDKATPEEIEQVFYLGFTTKKSGEGEGLGLHWVRTIVEDFHEGQVKARNRTDPSGAEFIIRLPLNAGEKTDKSASVAFATPEESRKEAP
ncbi:MAG: HAMP domain-containing sensor histidine kinase, partial [bacterium]